MYNVDTMLNGCREVLSSEFMLVDTDSEMSDTVNANRRDR